jgi:hypothetical protein
MNCNAYAVTKHFETKSITGMKMKTNMNIVYKTNFMEDSPDSEAGSRSAGQ